jgi:dihydrofolate reductase
MSPAAKRNNRRHGNRVGKAGEGKESILMRKLIYSTMVSLDGYVEGPNRNLDWGIIDEELHSFINDQHRTIDTFLFGRRMYEVMVYWDTADQDLSNPEYVLEFARIWKKIHKIVFSKTLEQVQGNATLSRGNIVEEIAKLKAQPGKDLSVGGATIASALRRVGLIDEYQLFIHPVVIGSGASIFPAAADKTNLQLIETHTFHSGVVLLRYQQAGPEL